MWEKIKGGVVENRGTAIILSLIIVTVLFILTSFLIRKVVTNTMMVRKAGEEQEGYALAKQGILYAVDRLNTWDGADPDYDPTAWLNGQNWDEDNWNPFDLNGDGENDVQIRIDKNDIPHPADDDPAFDSEEDDNGDPDYITIESQDLPKKLVTLQAIAKNDSPLLEYVRFINSDVRFSSNTTFGDVNNGDPFHINGNLILDGDANEIYLEDNQRFEVAGEIVSYDSGSAQTDKVKIIAVNGASFSSKTLDDDGSGSDGYGFTGTIVNGDEYSQLDPEVFNTVQGRYFDGVHLPSSYDYSEDPDNPQYVSGKSVIFWPQIKEERFWDSQNGTTRLADIAIASDDCGKREINNDVAPYYWWDDWYPSDNTHTYSYSDIGSMVANVYWRQEGFTTSYNYTPPGVHLIFSDTQDLYPSTGETTERLLQVNDDNTTDLPAEYETSASIDYSLFTSEDVVFCEKDVRVNGVLPRDLAIVSGGNIYIDSNIYTNGHSLALLAKENVVLNTTHRWVAGYEEDNWNDNGTSAAKLLGVTDGEVARAQVDTGGESSVKEQILNFGGGSSAQIVTTDRIILQGCNYEVHENKTLNFTAEVKLLEGGDWQPLTITSIPPFPTFPISGPDSGYGTIVLETPPTFRSFSRIRLTAIGGDTGDDPAGWIQVDAVEVPITDMDRMAIFAENGSWYLIAGYGASENNDQQEPFTLNGALSQEELEEMTKWTDGSGREADWDQISYVYDSDLVTTPPPALPPSVNLVSLRRKGED